MTPQQTLDHVSTMLTNMEEMKKKSVFVGLPKEKIGGKIYGDGMTVLRIGAIHEFGYGPIPKRSFLRAPFRKKSKVMNIAISGQFEAVSNGLSVDIGLGRIGVAATNISKGAFRSKGYGKWKDIKQSTKDAKGSSGILIDTGILRSSITWVIR